MDTATPDVAQAPGDELPARTDRRVRRFRLAGVLIVAAAVLAWGGVRLATAVALGQVHQYQDIEPVTCTGAEISSRQNDDGDIRPVVALTPDMSCLLRFHLANDGPMAVEVTAVLLDGFGSGNAMSFAPLFVNPNGSQRADDVDGAARFELAGPLRLDPGSSIVLEAAFSYSGGAMVMECGSTAWWPPSVEVSGFGSTRVIADNSDRTQVWFLQGTPDNCD